MFFWQDQYLFLWIKKKYGKWGWLPAIASQNGVPLTVTAVAEAHIGHTRAAPFRFSCLPPASFHETETATEGGLLPRRRKDEKKSTMRIPACSPAASPGFTSSSFRSQSGTRIVHCSSICLPDLVGVMSGLLCWPCCSWSWISNVVGISFRAGLDSCRPPSYKTCDLTSIRSPSFFLLRSKCAILLVFFCPFGFVGTQFNLVSKRHYEIGWCSSSRLIWKVLPFHESPFNEYLSVILAMRYLMVSTFLGLPIHIWTIRFETDDRFLEI